MQARKRNRVIAALLALALGLSFGLFVGCSDPAAPDSLSSASLPTLRPAGDIPEDSAAEASDPGEDFDSLPDFPCSDTFQAISYDALYTGVTNQKMNAYLERMHKAGYRILRGEGIWSWYASDSRLVYNDREILLFTTVSAERQEWFMKRFLAGRADDTLQAELQVLLPDDEVLCAVDLTQEEVYLQTGLRRVLCVTFGYGPVYRYRADLSPGYPPAFSIFPVLLGPRGLLTEEDLYSTDLDSQLFADIDGDGTAEFITMSYPAVTDIRLFTVRAYSEIEGYPVLTAFSEFSMNTWSTPSPTLELRDGKVCLADVPILQEGMRLTIDPTVDRDSLEYSPFHLSLEPMMGMSFAALQEALGDTAVYSSSDCLIADLSETHHPSPYLVAAISGNSVSVTGLATFFGGNVNDRCSIALIEPPDNPSALLRFSREQLAERFGAPHFHGDSDNQLCWFTRGGLILRITLAQDERTEEAAVFADLYDPASGDAKLQAWVEGWEPEE